MGVDRGKIEMLLDPAHARLEVADQDAMAMTAEWRSPTARRSPAI